MSIKIKYKNPKSTDFGPNDIVINVREGTIFYKSEKGIFKLQGDNLNTKGNLINFNSSISSSRGFFAKPGLGSLKIQGKTPLHTFKVGQTPTLEVGGHIMPSGSPSPIYDLGSPNTPFRDLYLSPNSIKFIKTRAGIGGSRVGTTFIVGQYKKETIPEEEETFTQDNVIDLKAGRTIATASKTIEATGDIESEDGITNYIRPEVIYHPTDDEAAIIHKTAGRLQYRSQGGDPLDIYCDGVENDKIRLGSTTTNRTEITFTGNVTASGNISASGAIVARTSNINLISGGSF